MKPNSKFVAAVVAAALATTGVAQIASAASETAAETEQATQVAGQSIQIPENGKHILDGVRAARLALFDGNIDLAKEMIAASHDQINDRAAEYAVKLDANGGFALPVDSGLQFKDGFQPTDQHAPVINEAGALIQNGQVDEAISVMNDAGIELDIKVVMLPVGKAASQLDQAIADIEAGQIHKANMALKSVETSIEVQDYQPGGLPAQGYPLSEILTG
ncbi:hypothetical protein RA27_17980 [Ruegeria sp. ANG-R]|uniref:YfdX family protein n=1 Tax=Ruegeria sp. ANG-R TaxID=1577903 RepID=UPI00057F1AD0|nr:YfdX family protein [Ruegeria sp. ANG-R]KIC39045.1 hypothetical protein RA27_17980 [Ruegeria sp. ANG-R]